MGVPSEAMRRWLVVAALLAGLVVSPAEASPSNGCVRADFQRTRPMPANGCLVIRLDRKPTNNQVGFWRDHYHVPSRASVRIWHADGVDDGRPYFVRWAWQRR